MGTSGMLVGTSGLDVLCGLWNKIMDQGFGLKSFEKSLVATMVAKICFGHVFFFHITTYASSSTLQRFSTSPIVPRNTVQASNN